MKRNLGIIFLILAVVSCQSGGRGEANQDSDNTRPAELTQIEIQIEGMTCTGCENTVMAGIKELEGIQEVSASHTEGLAKVTFDASRSGFEQMKEKIEKRGYTVTGHQTLTKEE